MRGPNGGCSSGLHATYYRVQAQGEGINLQVGYSHQVVVEPLPGISFEVEGNNKLMIRGIDKQVVGEMAARIRRIRPPDSYKGKGIRYAGEKVRIKAGKSGAKGAA